MRLRAAASVACAVWLAAAMACGALAAAVAPAADSAAFEVRIRHLETQLRCLVCQNQTLADSNASLADDLRREVRGLALAGKSDDEIRSYLVARYGDFVLYDPPVKGTTWLLWLGPFALLLGGAGIWAVVVRRRTHDVPATSAQHVDRARAMLDEAPPLG